VASAGSGVYTASYTPTTAGTDNVSITLNGTAISGSPSASTVSPGAATQLAVAGLPSAYITLTASNVTVTARDAFGNVADGYTGTVSFTSSDTQATLPPNYTFTSDEAGAHTFPSGVVLVTPGSQTVTVTDVGNSFGGSQTVLVL